MSNNKARTNAARKAIETLRAAGWTHRAIGDALGLGGSAVSVWKNGANPPSQENLHALQALAKDATGGKTPTAIKDGRKTRGARKPSKRVAATKRRVARKKASKAANDTKAPTASISDMITQHIDRSLRGSLGALVAQAVQEYLASNEGQALVRDMVRQQLGKDLATALAQQE